MKQVININFQGRVIPIEVTAFDLVKAYTESLKLHFSTEEGKEEIINDIEGRIGELFHQKIKSGAACITDIDVEAVIASIGRPEQFDSEEPRDEESTSESSAIRPASGPKKLYRNEGSQMLGGVCAGIADYFNVDVVIIRILFIIFFGPLLLPYIILWIALPGTSEQTLGAQTKKLFRDADDRIVAGVCGGLGKYFGINVWIPRIIFLLPLIALLFDGPGSFFFPGLITITLSPGSILIYLLLWLLIPRARTAAEKLQMRGEKVDIGSLQNRVIKEAKVISATAQDRVKEIKSDISEKTNNGGSIFGRLLLGFFKVILYMVMGLTAFIAFIIIFSLGITSLALFPLKDFFLQGGWQNILAWLTLVFLVVVPLIAAFIWIIRKIVRVRSHSKALRVSFLILWLLGLITGIMLLISSATEFRHRHKSEPIEIKLTNPRSMSLEIIAAPGSVMLFNSERNFDINVDNLFYLDSIPFNYVKVIQHPTDSDSFRVYMRTLSFGRSRREAEKNGAGIHPLIESADSSLSVDAGIQINRKNKFRGQHLILEVYVPAGKKLLIDEGFETEGESADVPQDENRSPPRSTNI
jgi:phage shock protein PspC (stress-responsive transcriptional regulator)